jgi:hypothetical protein
LDLWKMCYKKQCWHRIMNIRLYIYERKWLSRKINVTYMFAVYSIRCGKLIYLFYLWTMSNLLNSKVIFQQTSSVKFQTKAHKKL